VDADTQRDFVAFVEARSGALFHCALALTGHRQQAEDLLQTALLKAYGHWSWIRSEQPEAYVRKVMYHQQVSWWRRMASWRERSTDQVPEQVVTDLTERVDLSLMLRAALGRLAPKHRAVLVLRYLEDLPDDEIADILGCKPTTVRTQAMRALDRLRASCPELETLTTLELRR
jgi:RNA polymerase sigma-70 factor (sigma-E family)